MSRLILGLLGAALTGCTVSPAPLMTIPPSHAASADAPETPYVPPPNPFAQDLAPAQPPGPKEAPVDHSHHGDASKSTYPIDICVLSGEKLGSMGKPVVMQHQGREVQLCCAGCIDKFKQDPDKFLKKLDELKKSGKHEHGGESK